MKQISRHNDVIAGIIEDPMECRLEADVIIGDGDGQINLKEIETKIKDQYAEVRRAGTDEFKETLIGYGITPLELNTVETVVYQIRRLLSGRR
jgi:hypothetical protein